MSILSELKKLTNKNNATVISEALPDSMSGGSGIIILQRTEVDPQNLPDYINDYINQHYGSSYHLVSAYTITNISADELASALEAYVIPLFVGTYIEDGKIINGYDLVNRVAVSRDETTSELLRIEVSGDYTVINNELWDLWMEHK